jgi:translation elongation factor EF-Ts
MRCYYESYEEYYGVANEFPSSGKHLFYEIDEEDEEEIKDEIYDLIAEGEIDSVNQNITLWLYCYLIDDEVEVEDIYVSDYFTQEEIDKIIEETEV